jgi:hypothetical protein
VSCGEGTPPPPPQPSTLIIVNRSQYELHELYVHDQIANYRGKPNLLGSSSLTIDAQIVLQPPSISNGQWYVTAVRHKEEKVGVLVSELVALTTAWPIDLQGGTYTLWVLDEHFRLWEPERSDSGPPRDALSGERRRDLGDGAPRADRRAEGPRADVPSAEAKPSLDGQVGEAQ